MYNGSRLLFYAFPVLRNLPVCGFFNLKISVSYWNFFLNTDEMSVLSKENNIV